MHLEVGAAGHDVEGLQQPVLADAVCKLRQVSQRLAWVFWVPHQLSDRHPVWVCELLPGCLGDELPTSAESTEGRRGEFAAHDSHLAILRMALAWSESGA